MRLIDADALKADIEQFNRPLCDGYHMKDYVLNQIITDIENQPTVDAVPVKHGKWKKSGKWGRVYKCDQCGNYLDFDGVNVGRGSANYCPNCGARMDAERREE